MIESAVTDLPEPELADEREGFALLDVERHLVDGEHFARAASERDRQVADREEG